MTARLFALFVALLTIMNLLGDWLWPGFDASIWWIRLGTLPAWLSKFLLAVSAFTLIPYSMAREVAAFWTDYLKQKPAPAAATSA